MPRPVPERRKLTPAELESALTALPAWSVRGEKLHAEFKFPDFVAAFGFMSKVALHAEQLDHHPDWSNVYNRVTIDLLTHDVGAITAFDIELARRISEVV